MSSFMDGSWDAYLASLADFAGADDIITNLAEKREPGTEITESFAYYQFNIYLLTDIFSMSQKIFIKKNWRKQDIWWFSQWLRDQF